MRVPVGARSVHPIFGLGLNLEQPCSIIPPPPLLHALIPAPSVSPNPLSSLRLIATSQPCPRCYRRLLVLSRLRVVSCLLRLAASQLCRLPAHPLHLPSCPPAASVCRLLPLGTVACLLTRCIYLVAPIYCICLLAASASSLP